MRHSDVFRCLLALLITGLLVWPAASVAQSITRFFTGGNSALFDIVSGPDGALWTVDEYLAQVDRVATDGTITSYQLPVSNSEPKQIVNGPDGALWFTENITGKIGRITTSGQITEFAIPSAAPLPIAITTGADGALWFTEMGSGSNTTKIGRLTVNGVFTEYPVPWLSGIPGGITTGPDGAIWVTDDFVNVIARVTADGKFTVFQVPDRYPRGIVTGPDGALWFTELAGGVGRMTTDGTLTDYPIPGDNSAPEKIIRGADGAMWFADFSTGNAGRITTDGNITLIPPMTLRPGEGAEAAFGIAVGPDGAIWLPTIDSSIYRIFPVSDMTSVNLLSSILPISRSVVVGHSATAFAAVVNAGSGTGNNCILSPAAAIPAGFSFQATNPTTNAPVGGVNVPIDIPAGTLKTFTFSFTADAPFVPEEIVLGFSCANSNPAPSTTGLNTFLLSASTVQPPDIVAVSATLSADGIVDIPGATAAGVFVVATSNVGTDGTIIATADTGEAMLPVRLTICQTNPTTGICIGLPATQATVGIAAGGTPTFGVFVQGQGNIPFAPATSRIFVRFKDAGGVERGATSVAVRTQ